MVETVGVPNWNHKKFISFQRGQQQPSGVPHTKGPRHFKTAWFPPNASKVGPTQILGPSYAFVIKELTNFDSARAQVDLACDCVWFRTGEIWGML